MTPQTFNPALDIQRLHELAAKRIYIGTSSWKYEGWLDQIYQKEEFMKFGKGGKLPTLNKSKFNANSLESFSKVFPTVCYDGAYYQVPSSKTLETLESQVPDDFKMTFKCTEKFTQRRHDVKKGGDGSLNSSYLRPERFGEEYLAPIQDIFKSKLGTIIFEFSPFFFDKSWGQNHDYDPEQFVSDLDKFLGGIPKGISYGVEVRDDIFIYPGFDGYLNCLKAHNVSHVINEQTHMPAISEQIKRKGIITSDRIVIRALTRRGMTHSAAVKCYEPYDKTLEPLPEMRSSIAQLIMEALENGWEMQTYVNNRAEGNAPNTIHAILDLYDELCGVVRDYVPQMNASQDLFG